MTEFVVRRGESPKDSDMVARGWVLPDARVALAWLGEHKSMTFYETPEDFLSLHREGHPDTWVLCVKEGWPWHMVLESSLARWEALPPYGVTPRAGPFVVQYARAGWGNE